MFPSSRAVLLRLLWLEVCVRILLPLLCRVVRRKTLAPTPRHCRRGDIPSHGALSKNRCHSFSLELILHSSRRRAMGSPQDKCVLEHARPPLLSSSILLLTTACSSSTNTGAHAANLPPPPPIPLAGAFSNEIDAVLSRPAAAHAARRQALRRHGTVILLPRRRREGRHLRVGHARDLGAAGRAAPVEAEPRVEAVLMEGVSTVQDTQLVLCV